MAAEHGIGRRIAEARKTAGLTQEAFARATGFSVSAVRSWEYDVMHPRPATLRKIAEVTGRPVAWFYEATEAAA